MERRKKRKQVNMLAGIASLVVVTIYVVNLGLDPEQTAIATTVS